jgi:hypothetical protein
MPVKKSFQLIQEIVIIYLEIVLFVLLINCFNIYMTLNHKSYNQLQYEMCIEPPKENCCGFENKNEVLKKSITESQTAYPQYSDTVVSGIQ